jgi:hypothetical protein
MREDMISLYGQQQVLKVEENDERRLGARFIKIWAKKLPRWQTRWADLSVSKTEMYQHYEGYVPYSRPREKCYCSPQNKEIGLTTAIDLRMPGTN